VLPLTAVLLRRWAVAVPAFVLAAVAQGVVLYVASNFLLSPPPASFDTISGENPDLPGGTKYIPLWSFQMFRFRNLITDDRRILLSDEHARDPASSSPATGADQPVEPISDIGIDRMNHLMFADEGSRFIQFQEGGLN
jgi:phosphatidylinositol glycan class P protein